jgi:hypothetical protein
MIRILAALSLLLGLGLPQFAPGADLQVEVVTQLKRTGSDVSKPHRFDFYFYLPTEARAKAIAQELQTHGLSTRVRPGAKGPSWLCLASATVIPNAPTLKELGGLFITLSNKHGGEFDGWEAELVR